MASVTPRASGFWTESTMGSNYFPSDAEDVEQQENLIANDPAHDGRTPLDRTIDRIGMGSYQWTLLSLCGFGWMADNMWIQAIAIILPRVQQHFSVPDSYIGALSSSMFGGMMIGAVGWGTCSDLMGRSAAFNATLFFTAVFGLLASRAHSFPTLCILLFFLGSAVGGSMPTDGTLILEYMPKSKQYLVTALSVFFSFGSVLSAVVALLTIPQHSCHPPAQDCDPETQNQGWKYLLIALGLITLAMFLARIVFFRLHESPRYLVHAGRPQEALESLQMISRFNGSDLSIEIEDVADHHKTVSESPIEERSPISREGFTRTEPTPRITSTTGLSTVISDVTQYDSTGSSAAYSDGQADVHTTKPIDDVEQGKNGLLADRDSAAPDETSVPRPRSPPASRRRSHRLSTTSSRRPSSIYEAMICSRLPRWLRKPLLAWWDRILMVLSPEWIRITILMWATWFSMSLAYTMFNVYLPKLLETGPSATVVAASSRPLEDSLWDVVIFTIGGCPGAILGAYLIESSLGRRWSLAGSTFITAFLCIIFVVVESSWAVRASTVGISLSATAMWAVLYGWTPEIFGTRVRGTACGIASALSRIGGMIAPLLGGTLLMMDRVTPVYASVAVFILAGFCVLLLKEGDGEGGKHKRARTFVH